MGLFSSDKKIEKSPNKIRPTVIRTQNVSKEMAEIARKNNVNLNTLDFDILEIQTYTRVNKDRTNADWEEISVEEMHKLDDASMLLNENFQIKQSVTKN